MNPESFQKEVSKLGIELSGKQIEQLSQYAEFLIAYNEKVNLTNITELSEIYEKHFYDSLLIAPLLENAESICDVGSGAGFPGVVLKIVFPGIKLTIMEPLQKRVRFLQLLAEKLQLDIRIENIRAEEAGEQRESFDAVVARAVAELAILAELCIPLVKKDGIFIAMKGSKAYAEIKTAEKAVRELGCVLKTISDVRLPGGESRINIVYRKLKPTADIFPRKYAVMKKKPL